MPTTVGPGQHNEQTEARRCPVDEALALAVDDHPLGAGVVELDRGRLADDVPINAGVQHLELATLNAPALGVDLLDAIC